MILQTHQLSTEHIHHGTSLQHSYNAAISASLNQMQLSHDIYNTRSHPLSSSQALIDTDYEGWSKSSRTDLVLSKIKIKIFFCFL